MSRVSGVASGIRRRPRRDDVRRALLDAAAEVFARRGIEATSMDEVAAAAGFTKGALYSNFSSKEGLVTALAEDRASAYLTLGLAAVDVEAATLRERVRALGNRLTAAMDEQGDWQLLFVELWARAVRRGPADDGFRRRRRELHGAVAAAVADQTALSGTALPLSPAETATIIMALANGLAIQRQLEADSVPDDLLARVLELLLGEG